MSAGYSVWDDLGQDDLIVDALEDLGPVIGLRDKARVYERESGQLLEWNGEEYGWTVVRAAPQEVITPGPGVFDVTGRSTWRIW